MSSFEDYLQTRIDEIRKQDLFRELRRVDSPQSPRLQIHGKSYVNFSSNDYLGLANEASVKEAASKAVEKYGAGSGASRLICGSLAPHHELEAVLAEFKQCEAALSFSSGYAAAVGTICALLDKNDIIILDKLVHASIVDAARLCGAKLRVFAHNNLEDLEGILKWAAQKAASSSEKSRVLIVTESVFSMDGDAAPLREMVELKERFGAWLMVDEAHGTGLYGELRRGLAEEMGVSHRIEVQMGTLGKALGASGGYIAGSRRLIDVLVNRARSFIFSTAPVPAASAAALAALRLLQSEEGEKRRQVLWNLVRRINTGMGLNRDRTTLSAIIPIIIGDEKKAVAAADALRERGVFVPAIRYPTVARGEARLRITVTAAHGGEGIDALLAARKLIR